MASLRKLPTSKNWIACYRGPDGKRKQRSTGEKDRRKAQRIAEEYEAAAKGQRTAAQVQSVLSEILEHHGQELPLFTFRDYCKEILRRKQQRNIAPSTLTNNQTAFTQLERFFGDTMDKPMASIRTQDLERWQAWRLESAKASTVSKNRQFITEVFNQAAAEGVIPRNVAAKELFRPLTVEQTNKRGFSTEELRAIFQTAEGELRGLCMFALYTGQRLQDICLCRWSDLNLFESVWSLRRKKSRGRLLDVPLVPPLLTYISTELSPQQSPTPLFPHCCERVQKAGKASPVSVEFGTLLERAGVREPSNHKSGSLAAQRTVHETSFHSFRHNTTSILKAAGVPEAVAMAIVGHETKAMSRAYTHLSTTQKIESMQAVARLDELLNSSESEVHGKP